MQLVNVRVKVRPVTLRDHVEGVPGLELALITISQQPGCAQQSHTDAIHSALPIEESAVERFIEMLRLMIDNPDQCESVSAEFLAALLPYREYVPHPLLAAD